MKIGSGYLQKYNELDSWLNKSTQKENFIKIISAYKNVKQTEPAEQAVIKTEANQIKNEKTISEKLIGAAETFFGKKYDDVNCYELVVESLEKTGVNYKGQNGIASYLAMKAKSDNLPINAYMTGEGLVAAAGSHVYSKSIDNIDDPVAISKTIADEMESKLEKGSILSFSMQTKGHTGIISKAGSDWTFINSGKMDHNLRESSFKKAVGEEPLKAEILNWLKLAAGKKESLTVTLGKFEDQKIASFIESPKKISMKV